MGKKIAVILFNLGGPDDIKAVRPFLYNLFSDKFIIGCSTPFRQILALLIVILRGKKSESRYLLIGGKSPLLQNTNAQAKALEKDLKKYGNYKCFVAMRYWHPFIKETCKEIKNYAPDIIVRLPLYPQFSHTTTASSFKEFERHIDFPADIKTINSYPSNKGFICALVENIKKLFTEVEKKGKTRLLLVAHGLPKENIRRGDPYKKQCEQTAQEVTRALGIKNLDWVLCYQSRVGLKKWTEPSLDCEIERAGLDKVCLVVAPISFVSEHIETLVEIAKEAKERANLAKIPSFSVVPTVGTSPEFIHGLTEMIIKAVE